jgi:hypothetical protein
MLCQSKALILQSMKRLFVILFFFCSSVSWTQLEVTAVKANERIIIDGEANDEIWSRSPMVGNFIQFKPNPGQHATHQTEVKVAYDDQAFYLFAHCYDDPALQSRVLSQRDDFNANVDNFQVLFDTYNDDINGFLFGVSSMGVQADAKVTVGSRYFDLNMVWSSTVKQVENGWQVEIKIPYSALRFPKKEVQSWGINFYRYISRGREESTWSPIKPDFDNLPAQCGELKGVSGIEPPVRLAFIPYLSAYAERMQSNGVNPSNGGFSFNGGMDIKLGVNEAFTLDVTLVPDFGQVVFDNQVLNLSPFEIQFNENRQFFTEGTELFSKSGLFYSRRIGIQSPYAVLKTNLQPYEFLENVPSSSQLINASKFSGRTKKGLGIGVFNGLTAEQYATAISGLTGSSRSVLVSPLTNYNVLVLDQNLPNNSSVTFTNTNVMRAGNFYDANVSAINAKLNTPSNAYFLSLRGVVSSLFFSEESRFGHSYGLRAGKQTGQFITNLGYQEESDTYNPNDLGFNANNNKRILEWNFNYRVFKPFWKFNQFFSSFNLSYNRLYRPDVYTATYLNTSAGLVSRKFNANGVEAAGSLTESFDYFEPRATGRYFVRPTWMDVGMWYSSNYQKPFALDVSANYVFIGWNDWKEYYYRISPRLRLGKRLFMLYEFDHYFSFNGRGYAVAFQQPSQLWNGILFGLRDRINLTQTLNFQYTVTNKMSASFRLRYYRSTVKYSSFFDLNDEGRLEPIVYTGQNAIGQSAFDANYNAFTIDLVYRWVFLPGSELNVVWKNAVFLTNNDVAISYWANTKELFEGVPFNSFSVKLIYWLDYQQLKRKKKMD